MHYVHLPRNQSFNSHKDCSNLDLLKTAIDEVSRIGQSKGILCHSGERQTPLHFADPEEIVTHLLECPTTFTLFTSDYYLFPLRGILMLITAILRKSVKTL